MSKTLQLFNSLNRKTEEFTPMTKDSVAMYLCGPTVYDNAHIGHMRKYVGDDVLIRTLEYVGYKVTSVMNITDVGHLVSDADEGEDKMEKGARKYGLNVWQLAEQFTEQFFASTRALQVKQTTVVCKATDHIREQIAMVTQLTENGFTYETSDGIYFDTSSFEKYGELSSMDEVQEGARVEANTEKRNSRDFALWKFSPHNETRQMEWIFSGPRSGVLIDDSVRNSLTDEEKQSKGFPGWHIECSAMAVRYLGEQFDIHTGGIDHKETHHPNEIAQAEASSGKAPFVRYWVHHNFLKIEGEKMSKSLGNLYTVQDIINKGIDPLALRYLFFTTHYRSELNFTWQALLGSQKALRRLQQGYKKLLNVKATESYDRISSESKQLHQEFMQNILHDLNTPQALAVVWKILKSETISTSDARFLLEECNTILALIPEQAVDDTSHIPADILKLADARQVARTEKQYSLADSLRDQILEAGYEIEDVSGTYQIRKRITL